MNPSNESLRHRYEMLREELPPFHPHSVCRGGWLQTLSAKFGHGTISLDDRSDRVLVEVADDEPSRDKLSGFYLPPVSSGEFNGKCSRPLVVLLHGMGGHAESGYMLSMAQCLSESGYPCILWNHRGAGRSADTCRRLHHPGKVGDVHLLVQHLSNERPAWSRNGLACVGFSLGANLMLNYLIREKESSGFSFAVAISAPLDMNATSRSLSHVKNVVFDQYLLAKLRAELLRPAADISSKERSFVESASSVRSLDETFTARHLRYEDVESFYRDNSPIHTLASIRTPTLVIHAEDDPVALASSFRRVRWEENDWLFPLLVPTGGHTGFLDRNRKRWHELAAATFLDSMQQAD